MLVEIALRSFPDENRSDAQEKEVLGAVAGYLRLPSCASYPSHSGRRASASLPPHPIPGTFSTSQPSVCSPTSQHQVGLKPEARRGRRGPLIRQLLR